jgi:hypothetical protein
MWRAWEADTTVPETVPPPPPRQQQQQQQQLVIIAGSERSISSDAFRNSLDNVELDVQCLNDLLLKLPTPKPPPKRSFPVVLTQKKPYPPGKRLRAKRLGALLRTGLQDIRKKKVYASYQPEKIRLIVRKTNPPGLPLQNVVIAASDASIIGNTVKQNTPSLPLSLAYFTEKHLQTAKLSVKSAKVLKMGLTLLSPTPISWVVPPAQAFDKQLADTFERDRIMRIINTMKLQNSYCLLKIIQFEFNALKARPFVHSPLMRNVKEIHDTLKFRCCAALDSSHKLERMFEEKLPDSGRYIKEEKNMALNFYQALNDNQLSYMRHFLASLAPASAV